MELRIHPLEVPEFVMKYRAFNSPPITFSNPHRSDALAVLTDVPSFRSEPLMPSDDQVMSWLLLFYEAGPPQTPVEYWNDYARERHDGFMESTNPDGRTREAARRATAGAASDEEKLKRLSDWCRAHIRNTLIDTSLTARQLRRLKSHRSPGDVLASGAGSWSDIDRVFAALARAARFDVRRAMINTRTDVPVDLSSKLSYFMRSWDVAVRIGEGWVFFDPGNPWVAFGMLPWDEEGTRTIITGPKEGLVATTPLTGEEVSTRTSIADLALDADGTLQGAVRVVLAGQVAADRREKEQDDTPGERVDAWVADLREGLGAVDVLEPRIESRPASDSSYVFSCKVRIPGYAQRTERRIVLQPAVFRRQAPALFPETRRRYPVVLPYPWSERDSVTIRLPDAYVLEVLSEAHPLEIQDVGRCQLDVRLSPDGRAVLATRDFRFGESGHLWVPLSSYPVLKEVFDTIRERDAQTLVLTKAPP